MNIEDENKFRVLTETTIGLTKALAVITASFYSFKAIQDTLNIALFETNNESRQKAIDYLKSLSVENKATKLAEETAIKEIEDTLEYLQSHPRREKEEILSY